MAKTAALALLTCCLSGCSLFVGSTQPITIRTTDPDADIYVDGKHVGTGNVVVEVERRKRHSILVKNADHAAVFRTGYALSSTGELDRFFTFFLGFPVFGLLADGSRAVVPDDIDIPIKPAKKSETHGR